MLYIIICGLTIYVAQLDNLMYGNITGVSMNPQYHYWIVLYTFILSLFFAVKMNKIYSYLLNDQKIYHIIIQITSLVMFVGSLLTYQLNSQDIISWLHVFCSFCSCVSFLMLLFVYTRKLSYDFLNIYNQIHQFFNRGIQFLIILLIIFTRVNGYLEIAFTLFVCCYLYMIEKEMDSL